MTHASRPMLLLSAAFLVAAPECAAQAKVPDQIKIVTAMLRKLDEPDLANTIENDIRAGRTTIGNTGDANAVTGVGALDRSFILRPLAGATGLGTGTADNRMTISAKALADIRTDPAIQGSANQTNVVVGWALTLRHEYEHMRQYDPHPNPLFENPAYSQTIKSGVGWYNSTKAELQESLNAPPTRENLEKVRELRTRLDALGDQVTVIFNDMPAMFREGALKDTSWVTLDGGRARAMDAIDRNRGVIARDKAQINDATAKFETAVDAVNAPVSGTGVATVGGTTQKKKGIFDRINDALTKADKALTKANQALENKPAPASGASGSASTSAAAASGATAGGSTTLTLELPGYWGHLNYTVAGVQLDPPSGGDRGNVAGRSYNGKLAGSVLTISGTAISDNESSGPGSGDYYELVVEVNVGKEHGYYGYIAPRGERMNRPFNVRVPVSADATSGTFSISLLEQNRNYGPHGWVVSGTVVR